MNKDAKAFGYVDAVKLLNRFLPTTGGVWIMSQSLIPELFPPQKLTIAEVISKLFRDAIEWKED